MTALDLEWKQDKDDLVAISWRKLRATFGHDEQRTVSPANLIIKELDHLQKE